MIPEFQINPKIAAYKAEIHRLQTLVDKWVYYRETHFGNIYRGNEKHDFFIVYLDLCYLKNELKKYEMFLIKKIIYYKTINKTIMITLTNPSSISNYNIKEKVRFLKPKFDHPKFPKSGMDCCIFQMHNGRLAVFPYNQFQSQEYEGEDAKSNQYHNRNFYKVYDSEHELNENFEQVC